jgi:predicted DCC family thiol-disulfide oxidoreductase YuxK
VRANDPAATFSFAPLDSDAGREARSRVSGAPDSLLLVDARGVHAEGDAVLAIARGLRFPWPLLARLGAAVPRPVRDRAYRWIACRRRWFGG